MQDRLLAALVLVAGDVHEAHPGIPAQPLHALAELQLIEALRDVGLALCLQPAQPAACLRKCLVLRGNGVFKYFTLLKRTMMWASGLGCSLHSQQAD